MLTGRLLHLALSRIKFILSYTGRTGKIIHSTLVCDIYKTKKGSSMKTLKSETFFGNCTLILLIYEHYVFQ